MNIDAPICVDYQFQVSYVTSVMDGVFCKDI